MMKFKFDANQEYQQDAISAVVNLFEGQEKTNTKIISGSSLFGIYQNVLSLSEEDILTNVKNVQEKNALLKDNPEYKPFEDTAPFAEENKTWRLLKNGMDFCVEMETGTGKTYVYLRTIFELNKKYDWKKFIILVPSVAIREGVIKTLQITQDHFRGLYDNTPYRFYEYTSKNITQVKHFADSNVINIMVMTVGAFNKDANVLYSERDQMQGEQPITFIKKTNPILILDEPQNMEGEATKKALDNFNSLFRLRYSATHKNQYNLVYQLAPYDAYQLGLVKRIEVFSVTDDDSGLSVPYMALLEAKPAKTASSIKAKLEVAFVDADGNRKRKPLFIKKGDDLAEKGGNNTYSGYVVTHIEVDAPDFGSEAKVHFENGFVLTRSNQIGQNKEDIFRKQIAETVRLHFEKRGKYRDLGIKVLSLFFIDKVSNYVEIDGVINKVFTEEFNRLKKEYQLNELDIKTAKSGYFAKRKDGSYIEQDSAIEKNDEAFELIMKDKERLLSFDEPVEFIFSHSALREGWDNPNVFNICTLNETHSMTKKRQEIGRGMRLCVNQDGERIFDKRINLLSVVANVSYADYVSQLQGEFQEDGIYKAPPVPGNAKKKRTVKLKAGFDKNDNFIALWNRISKKTRYVVHVNTEALIERSAKVVSELRLERPHIRVERAGIDIGATGVKGFVLGAETGHTVSEQSRLVDCIELIKSETHLTRGTVADILLKSGNTKAFINNPEKFCVEVSKIIKQELLKDYVDHISYVLLDETYSVANFKNVESYKDSTIDVGRSIYDAIIHDSDVEKQFALNLDSDERIKLFIKLPNWFKVGTPVGGYNPDWAIVTAKRDLKGNESEEKIYFVIETKGDVSNLRPTEKAKIESAKKHFEIVKVNYKEVESYQQFVNNSLS